MIVDLPRPLTADEARVLQALLSQEFAGAAELRLQAAAALVCRRCDCGCPSVDFSVPQSAPSAPVGSRFVPAEAEVIPIGDEPPGQIILLVDDGVLSSLEYVWVTDHAPAKWPDQSRLRPSLPAS